MQICIYISHGRNHEGGGWGSWFDQFDMRGSVETTTSKQRPHAPHGYITLPKLPIRLLERTTAYLIEYPKWGAGEIEDSFRDLPIELVPAAMLLHWLAYHKDILERDARKYFDALVPFPQ